MSILQQKENSSRGATREANKSTVMAFYEAAINGKDFEAAAKFIGACYVQHNPLIADGIDGFRTFVGYLRATFPKLRAEIKRIFADGDFVIVHTWSARARVAWFGDRRYFPARGRKDRRALGRHAADPGECLQSERDVLSRRVVPGAVRRAKCEARARHPSR